MPCPSVPWRELLFEHGNLELPVPRKKFYWHTSIIAERGQFPQISNPPEFDYPFSSIGLSMSSSLCNPLEYACRLNNESCQLMKQRLFQDAIANLHVALKAMKTIVIDTQENSTSFTSQSQFVPSQSQPIAGSIAQPCTRGATQTFWGQADEGALYVYENPMHIAEFSGYDLSSINRISFYIMFNLALSHHLRSVYGTNEVQCKKSLHLSKQLYELTYQLHGAYYESKNESNLMITAAILNNLLVVHELLGNEHEATLCQQSLLSAILLLVDMGEHHFLAMGGCQSALDGFMGNVIHLMSSVSPVARAA